MILRPGTNEDLSVLISWIEDKDACRIWAGPSVRFPLTLEYLKEDIGFSEENTFSLIHDNESLLGIGQLIQRENNRLHMARIIVSPSQRNKGFGSLLCRLLIRKGRKRGRDINFSLNVDPNNAKAIKLYKKLGFKPSQESPGSSINETTIHMVLKPGRASEARPPSSR